MQNAKILVSIALLALVAITGANADGFVMAKDANSKPLPHEPVSANAGEVRVFTEGLVIVGNATADANGY